MRVSVFLSCLLLTILNFTTCSTSEFKELKDLIKNLNKLYIYGTVTIFTDDASKIKLEGLFPLLMTSSGTDSMKPKLIFTVNVTEPMVLRNLLNGMCLSIVVIGSDYTNILLYVEASLRGARHKQIIFLFPFSPNWKTVDEILLIYCEWSWENQFINSLVMFMNSSQRYGCNPFPKIRPVNQSDWDAGKLMVVSRAGKIMNLNGKRVTIPFAMDKPRIFVKNRSERGVLQYSGLAWQILFHFIQYLNGEINPLGFGEDTGEKFVSPETLSEFLDNKTIEMTGNLVDGVDMKVFGATYPLQIIHACLVVPMKNKIPRYAYLLRPFDSSVWISIFSTSFVLGIFINYISI
ncbi:hypothetical protein ACFFRR_006497 [Megaselia abdita]